MEFNKDSSFRSVFVSNIPYEVSDDKLKDILSEVGQIVSFRMIMDSETFKPKGFAFCEFEDAGIANSAIRNLNGREVCGRNLRIAPASSKDDLKSGKIAGTSSSIESNLFGPVVPPENAPEEITKAVASLPPEQMFELMKQMKLFIMHQPEEARQLLLHNPQLPYALLQAQVVMRIVDPHQAHDFLHKPRIAVPNFNDIVENIHPVDIMSHQDVYLTDYSTRHSEVHNEPHYEYRQCNFNPGTPYMSNTDLNIVKSNHSAHRNFSQDLPQEVNFQLQHHPLEDIHPPHAPQDPRTIQDIKILNVSSQNRPCSVNFSRHSQSLSLKPITDTLREHPVKNIPLLDTSSKNFECLAQSIPVTNSDTRIDTRLSNPYIQPSILSQGLKCDVPHDPRKAFTHGELSSSISTGLELRHTTNHIPQHTVTLSDLNRDPASTDKSTNISSITQEEKTSLILQVLALTDEQIAQLTAEQRQSIILLKEQIAKQTGAAIQGRS